MLGQIQFNLQFVQFFCDVQALSQLALFVRGTGCRASDIVVGLGQSRNLLGGLETRSLVSFSRICRALMLPLAMHCCLVYGVLRSRFACISLKANTNVVA
jgi:hypothetical protein